MDVDSNFENIEIKLDQSAKDFLRQAGKWAHFLSIIAFIVIVLILLFTIIGKLLFPAAVIPNNQIGVYSESFGSKMIDSHFFYAVFLIPVYYMYKFSVETKTALRNNDQIAMTKSFEYLKSIFKFLGVLIILAFVLYILMMLFFILHSTVFK